LNGEKTKLEKGDRIMQTIAEILTLVILSAITAVVVHFVFEIIAKDKRR